MEFAPPSKTTTTVSLPTATAPIIEIDTTAPVIIANDPQKTRNASWGAIISILIILAMVVLGAFYAWGERIRENHPTGVHVVK